MNALHNARRRTFLLRAASLSAIGMATAALHRALAQGAQPPGVYRLEGDLRLNGVPAAPGMLVRPGDVVETGPGSQAVFSVGGDALLVRAGTRLEMSGSEALLAAMRVVTGRVLSGFGPGPRRIETATIGIRGTGIYIEAEPARTYVCTCYGVAEIEPRDAPQMSETISTRRHEQPRYVYAGTAMPLDKMMESAPVINHTDAELVLLESIVGRSPPFVGSGCTSYSTY